MMRKGLFLGVMVFGVASWSPLAAHGMVLSDEFKVNTYVTQWQWHPTVAMDDAGNFVVVWEGDRRDGSGSRVIVQLFHASGEPAGEEFLVSTSGRGWQIRPAVAMDDSGNFVITWFSWLQDRKSTEVSARLFNASGEPVGDELKIATFQTSGQADLAGVATAMTGAGNFVISWHGFGLDGDGSGVFARVFNASGRPVSEKFQVNTHTADDQCSVAVAADDAGDFVIAWASWLQDGDLAGVFAQRFDSAGRRVGNEFRVNTHRSSLQGSPAVAMASAGGFAIAWQSFDQDGDGYGVFAQRFDSTGRRLGNESQVNTHTTGDQNSPVVAMDDAGNFVIAWQSFSQDGDGYGIFAQRFDSAGRRVGNESQINIHATGDQNSPVTAMADAGKLIMAWQSYGQDGDGYGIFARSGAVPVQPCEGLLFSTEEDFLSMGPAPPDGNPIISDGDLLSWSGSGVNVCVRNRDLLKVWETELDVGLDAVDAIDFEGNEPLIAFSTELDDPTGRFTDGDLLGTNGAVLTNRALLASFKLEVTADIGLDALHFNGQTEAIVELLETIKEGGREFWEENPAELTRLLRELDVDIWFSTEGTVPFSGMHPLVDGDVLSARYGTIVARNADLLMRSVPAGLPNRGVDFGLDAVSADRKGTETSVQFSVEILYEGEPGFTDGDVLSFGSGVVIKNADLLAPLNARAKFLGLDALFSRP